jgi:hypothetical protein
MYKEEVPRSSCCFVAVMLKNFNIILVFNLCGAISTAGKTTTGTYAREDGASAVGGSRAVASCSVAPAGTTVQQQLLLLSQESDDSAAFGSSMLGNSTTQVYKILTADPDQASEIAMLATNLQDSLVEQLDAEAPKSGPASASSAPSKAASKRR